MNFHGARDRPAQEPALPLSGAQRTRDIGVERVERTILEEAPQRARPEARRQRITDENEARDAGQGFAGLRPRQPLLR